MPTSFATDNKLKPTTPAYCTNSAKLTKTKGYVINLEQPCYNAVMTNAESRSLRKEMYKAFSSRASKHFPVANNYCNEDVIEEILLLRHQISKTLRFNNYAEYVYDRNLREAKEKGYPSVTAMRNSKHPYRKFRKNYCENIDKRLGFRCTYTPPPPELILEAYENGHLKENYYEAWLDVDHKDGNPFNNTEENVQTLCKCCHNWKTLKDGDNLTAGRKTLRKATNNNIIMQEAA